MIILKINNLIKLSIYKNEKIVIENYKELRDIHEEEIVVDIYTIKGLFLKIKRMDNYMIEIEGIISQIRVEK